MIILSALIGCVSMQFVMRWKTLKAAMFVTFQRYLHYFSAPSKRRISESSASQTHVHEDDADDDEVDGKVPSTS